MFATLLGMAAAVAIVKSPDARIVLKQSETT